MPDLEPEPSQALWDSVAEGASWPRAHADEPVEPAKAESEWPTPIEEKLSILLEQEARSEASAELANAEPASGTQPLDVQPFANIRPFEDVRASAEVAPIEDVQAEDVQAIEIEHPVDDLHAVENIQAVENVLPTAAVNGPFTSAAHGEPAAEQPLTVYDAWEPVEVEEPKTEDRPTLAESGKLSNGWPDESAWSQSFEWPAMKSTDAPRTTDETPVDGDSARAAVSDIVAQMRAELASAKEEATEEADAPERDFWAKRDASPPKGAPPSRNGGSDARRDDVSRTVAEIRNQLKAGDFETSADGLSYDEGNDPAADEYASQESQAGPVMSEEEMRDEVRRAVEATRDELAGDSEFTRVEDKPAFKLAAPGSLPDWSHMQMEPSGPPVVVMKDLDGRVELASVYETLNELGCGDGAALLNYTPHSVTVGLPISAKFPSQEQVAGAVEKVFGLSARVESDGVRITVSIGDSDTKKRSVDAA
jgi:hypothetical protein